MALVVSNSHQHIALTASALFSPCLYKLYSRPLIHCEATDTSLEGSEASRRPRDRAALNSAPSLGVVEIIC